MYETSATNRIYYDSSTDDDSHFRRAIQAQAITEIEEKLKGRYKNDV